MEAMNKPQHSLSLPLKTRISLSLLSTMTNAARRSDGSVNRWLANLLNFTNAPAKPNPNPINGVRTADVTVDPSRNLWFRLFVPTQPPAAADLPVIVYFHGGGFVYLSPDSKVYDVICRSFAREVPAVVVSVNYRLAPEHRYPAQYEDCFDVLRFLDDNQSSPRSLPENAILSRCFLSGDSAGGNLAHHVAKRACESKFRQLKVIGVIAIQPFFGGEERTESERTLKGTPPLSVEQTDWMWKSVLPPGEGSDRDHEVINVSGPKAVDLSSLEFPATIVFVGGFDILLDWQMRYYQWLKRCGKEVYLVEYPNMCHAFYFFPELPEYAKLISEVGDFVHKCSKDVS